MRTIICCVSGFRFFAYLIYLGRCSPNTNTLYPVVLTDFFNTLLNLMHTKSHWENVYTINNSSAVSWFQEHAELSLKMINTAPPTARIIDVGGGASTLVDDLLAHGYNNLTVLDWSGAALAAAQARLGAQAAAVQWLEASILDAALPAHHYDIWHDRAVFHFLVNPEDRHIYLRQLTHALKPAGRAVIATFAADGPLQCSGLPVQRYAPEELAAELGAKFVIISSELETHYTPAGKTQNFIYFQLRKSQ